MQFWDRGIQFVDGCTKCSAGCKNCWSEAMTARFKRVPEVLTDGHFNGIVKVNMHLLEKAANVKKPHVYAIWNDLYHHGVDIQTTVRAWDIMERAKHHTFLIVTKRPESLVRPMPTFSPHIWHIVTCENQAMADKRIPHLLKIPGKRGLIIEPMLEGIDLYYWNCACGWTGYARDLNNAPQSKVCPDCGGSGGLLYTTPLRNIHQVILGPENGAGKRPFNPEWADSIKAQCESAGVPYYRKDKETGTLAWRVS